MTDEAETRDLLTLPEAAALSGLSANTLRAYVSGTGTKAPVLRGVKRGRDWMVRGADLDAYLAGRTKRPDRAKPTPTERAAAS